PLRDAATACLIFLAGASIIPVGLFLLFDLNSLRMVQQVMAYHAAAQQARNYGTWLFYNLYDFLLFLGIPLALIYSRMLFFNAQALARHQRGYVKHIDIMFLAFTLTLLVIDLSGSARGETARIWTAYVPILILFLTAYLTRELKTTKWQFIVVLLLQAAQV